MLKLVDRMKEDIQKIYKICMTQTEREKKKRRQRAVGKLVKIPQVPNSQTTVLFTI